jgi:hypothetical protein
MTEAPQATPDELAGIAWWNDLAEDQRRFWLDQAGTARASEAWACFKVMNQMVDLFEAHGVTPWRR